MSVSTALQYSGGKDSRAILHMYREQLNDIVVVWVNTGAPYPEMEKEMLQMSRKVPHFLIVRGNQPEQIKKFGYPSDVVPINYSPFGRLMVKSAHEFKLQSAFDCCSANMWNPLRDAMKMLSVTRIIRGQRRAETYTNAVATNGKIIDGIEYVLPIEDWSDEQVFEYLRANNVEIPSYYQTEGTSHDCWNCTAYLNSYEKRINNLPAPKRAEVVDRLRYIRAAITSETKSLTEILEAA